MDEERATGKVRREGTFLPPILFCKVGGPPENWKDLTVYNKRTGLEVDNVFYADCTEGVLKRYKKNKQGQLYVDQTGGGMAWEWICGEFEIREKGHYATRED